MPCGTPRLDRTRRVAGLHLRQFTFAPGCRLAPHEHDAPMMVVPVNGTFAGTMSGRRYDLSAGDLVVTPPGRSAGLAGPSGAVAVLINPVTPDIEVLLPTKSDLVRGPAPALTVRRLMTELRCPGAVATVSTAAAAFDLFAAAGRIPGEGPAPAWIDLVRDRLDAEAPESDVLEWAATETGFSPAHVSRTFSRTYGCSPGDYLRRRQLEQVATALADTDEPIARLAARHGFYDQAHLTRRFKAWSGFTPARYRRRFREPV